MTRSMIVTGMLAVAVSLAAVPFARAVDWTFEGHTDVVNAIAVTADRKIGASAGRDKTVKTWDAATGKERATLRGYTEEIFSVAISPDGKLLASSSRDETVYGRRLTTPSTPTSPRGRAASN